MSQEDEDLCSQKVDLKFLVDWASRIEMEFMSFKTSMMDALIGRFDQMQPPLRTSDADSEIRSINTSVKKLGEKIDSLKSTYSKKISQNNSKSQRDSSISRPMEVSPDVETLLLGLRSEVENLRNLQQQLVRNMNAQSVVQQSQLRNLEQQQGSNSQLGYLEIMDIKYFLKLLLPRVISIESLCHTMSLSDAQAGRGMSQQPFYSEPHRKRRSRELSDSPPPLPIPTADPEFSLSGRELLNDDNISVTNPTTKRTRLFP